MELRDVIQDGLKRDKVYGEMVSFGGWRRKVYLDVYERR